MKRITRILKLTPVLTLISAFALASSQPDRDPGSSERSSPAYSGAVDALFVGHSAMNNVVDDYVRTLAETYDSANDMRTVQITSEPGNDGLSLLGKMDREELDPVFRGAGHDFEIAVLTEQWDYESFYHHAEHGADTYGPVGGCPPSDDTYSADWANAPAI